MRRRGDGEWGMAGWQLAFTEATHERAGSEMTLSDGRSPCLSSLSRHIIDNDDNITAIISRARQTAFFVSKAAMRDVTFYHERQSLCLILAAHRGAYILEKRKGRKRSQVNPLETCAALMTGAGWPPLMLISQNPVCHRVIPLPIPLPDGHITAKRSASVLSFFKSIEKNASNFRTGVLLEVDIGDACPR